MGLLGLHVIQILGTQCFSDMGMADFDSLLITRETTNSVCPSIGDTTQLVGCISLRPMWHFISQGTSVQDDQFNSGTTAWVHEGLLDAWCYGCKIIP